MATLRFYAPKEVVNSFEFQEQIRQGASCQRALREDHVTFTDDFLALQPSSLLSSELLHYLDSVSSKVTMRLIVSNDYLIPGLRNRVNASLAFGDEKISFTNLSMFLLEANSSTNVYRLLRDFLPGLFPDISKPTLRKSLNGLNFRGKLRLILKRFLWDATFKLGPNDAARGSWWGIIWFILLGEALVGVFGFVLFNLFYEQADYIWAGKIFCALMILGGIFVIIGGVVETIKKLIHRC